jgi:hypothetical protein
MVILTSQEIARYRSELADDAQALEALDMIENCEGDMEDAAISLALQAGQEPNTSDMWLDGFAKRCRVVICQSNFRAELENGNVKEIVKDLIEQKICPRILAAPVVIYVVKTGVGDFCNPLDYQLQ